MTEDTNTTPRHDPESHGASSQPVEAMSPSLLGKLFGVPLLIIASIVAAAMIVVLCFGAPAAPQQRSLDDLLQALETSSGIKRAGMLMPREKEHWQAGLELTVRLERKELEFTDNELETVASRVGALVTAELEDMQHRRRSRDARGTAEPSGSGKRLAFLIRALGLCGKKNGIEVLIEVVRTGDEPHAALAMEQLGNLAGLPGASEAVIPIVDALERSSLLETRLVACTVLSVLADGSDRRVIEALDSTRLAAREGEVAWSAALALARLGRTEGKSTLLDLLDRSFWEAERVDETGRALRYRMPLGRVDQALIAAVDAASNLDEPDVWELIGRLQSDSSAPVRESATAAMSRRNKSG